MDTMRSLNTSLPQSPRKKRSTHPPEQLIQAFKTAALSVTNLYKTAAADQDIARESGYQDALNDLLTFLDRENIGLDDGEGWRIRQWATERLDGSSVMTSNSDSDEEQHGDTVVKNENHVSAASKPSDEDSKSFKAKSPTPVQADSVPKSPTTNGETPETPRPPKEIFTFHSSIPYPQEIDMQIGDAPVTVQMPLTSQPQTQGNTSPSAVRVEVVPQTPRSSQKARTHLSRHGTRSTTNTRDKGVGAGSKRRFTLGDYFDFGVLGDTRETSGGGKRGRYA